MKNGILGCPKNLVHDLSPACKMILLKNLQTYSVHILVCYICMCVCLLYPGHTLPVASDSMKTSPQKTKLHLGIGIHSTIGAKQKVETHLMKSRLFKNRIPISWISTFPICV